MDSTLQCRIRRKLHLGSDLARQNAPLPLTEEAVEYFQDSFPGEEGLDRLDMPMASTVCRSQSVSPCSMVISMLYAKRLRQRCPNYLQSMSSTDVFFISMMMASKYLYDEGVEEEVFNDVWADDLGQEVADVNRMEMDFLREMNWQLYVKQEEFDAAVTAIGRRLALKEGLKRGWFTYSEMDLLLDWQPMGNIWHQVGLDCSKIMFLMSSAYLAGLVSMVGSAAIALQVSGPLASATLAVLSLHSSIGLTGNSPALVPAQANVSAIQQQSLPLDSQASLSVPIVLDLPVEWMHPGDTAFRHDGSTENDTTMESSDYSITEGKRSVECAKTGLCAIEEDESVPGKVKKACVLSLWLLDSLLSQVWSVITGVQQQTANGKKGKPRDSSLASGFKSNGAEEGIMAGNNVGRQSSCRHCRNLKHQSRSQLDNFRDFHSPLVADSVLLSERLNQKSVIGGSVKNGRNLSPSENCFGSGNCAMKNRLSIEAVSNVGSIKHWSSPKLSSEDDMFLHDWYSNSVDTKDSCLHNGYGCSCIIYSQDWNHDVLSAVPVTLIWENFLLDFHGISITSTQVANSFPT